MTATTNGDVMATTDPTAGVALAARYFDEHRAP